ncbi:MAG: N-formylglutamate amidohydrolase [Bacteroidota bacterium]
MTTRFIPDLTEVAGTLSGAVGGNTRLLISCEHGGNRIPADYRPLFAGHEAALQSHRGYDPGALALARQMAEAFEAPLFACLTSRLLVDLNRSPGHPARFSEITRRLPKAVRDQIDSHHYLPYRQAVERPVMAALAAKNRVVHISSHSFTPVLDGQERNADVGFLYDPACLPERAFGRDWMTALQARAPSLKLRRNYPYRGNADGLCAWLRRRYSAVGYLGIELEVNQRHVAAGGPPWRRLCAAIVAALGEALDQSPGSMELADFP